MVKAYSIIENNTVVNRIIADEEFMIGLDVEYTDDPSAQIGCVMIDGVWTRPEVEQG